jgi:hypothetical protein
MSAHDREEYRPRTRPRRPGRAAPRHGRGGTHSVAGFRAGPAAFGIARGVRTQIGACDQTRQHAPYQRRPNARSWWRHAQACHSRHAWRASVPHAIALGVGHARTLQGLHCRLRTLYVARKLPSARRLKENSMATTISADTKPAGLIRELRTTFRDSAESSLRHTAASGSSGVTVSPGACVATPDSAESSMAGGGDSRVSCIAA